MALDRVAAVLECLEDLAHPPRRPSLDPPDPLKQLFYAQLGYDRLNQPIARSAWAPAARDQLAEIACRRRTRI